MVKVGVCGWGSFQLSSNCTIISFFDSEQPILLTLHTQPQQCEFTLERSGVKMVISVGNKKQKKKGGGGFRVFAADLTIDLTFSHRWAEFGLKCASRLERVRTVCCVGPMSAKKNFQGHGEAFFSQGLSGFHSLAYCTHWRRGALHLLFNSS